MDLAKENTKTEPLHLSGALRKRVSIQGYEGCFHQVAAYHYFGEDIDIVPCSTFREVTNMVESGEVDAGMMAIENSIAGSILPNYSLLQNCSLKITGEILLLIRQNLMALPGVGIEDIKEILKKNSSDIASVEIIRDNKTKTLEVGLLKDKENKYKLGVWVKNDVSGIGTMTFIKEDGS